MDVTVCTNDVNMWIRDKLDSDQLACLALKLGHVEPGHLRIPAIVSLTGATHETMSFLEKHLPAIAIYEAAVAAMTNIDDLTRFVSRDPSVLSNNKIIDVVIAVRLGITMTPSAILESHIKATFEFECEHWTRAKFDTGYKRDITCIVHEHNLLKNFSKYKTHACMQPDIVVYGSTLYSICRIYECLKSTDARYTQHDVPFDQLDPYEITDIMRVSVVGICNAIEESSIPMRKLIDLFMDVNTVVTNYYGPLVLKPLIVLTMAGKLRLNPYFPYRVMNNYRSSRSIEDELDTESEYFNSPRMTQNYIPSVLGIGRYPKCLKFRGAPIFRVWCGYIQIDPRMFLENIDSLVPEAETALRETAQDLYSPLWHINDDLDKLMRQLETPPA